MTLLVRLSVLTVSMGFVACAAEPTQGGDSAQPTPVSLLEPLALVPVEATDDPLAEHRPDDVDCPAAAWGEEGGGFEVQTGVCAYAAFDQPLSVELGAGDLIEISVWHDTLDASEPADGHVAVLLGGRVLWEETVAIPAPSAALDAAVILDATPSPGARLGLHLHNHGYNSWRFVEVQVTPP
jgi:hypothetical protein